MSTFDFEQFYDDWKNCFIIGVSKEKYSFDEALEVARRELDYPPQIISGQGYTRFRVGRDEYGEPRATWYLEDEERPRSCPCWTFRAGR